MQESLRYILRSGISRYMDMHLLISARDCQISLQNGCTNLYSYQQWMRVLANNWHCQMA